MAFNVEDIGSKEEPTPDMPKVYSDAYKHSIVDSQYNPGQNLLTMVSGTPRLVEYYRGVYNRNEEPHSFQPSDINTYQSYTRIKDLIIKEKGPASYSFNNQNGESTTMTEAFVSYDLTPVKGDVIIMDIGDGNAGLFTVQEQPEIHNFTADKVYTIQYQLMCIVTEEIFSQLNARVVEELVYTKDSVLNGGNAVIDKGTYQTQKDLMGWRETIARYIMVEHYWTFENSIVIKEPNPNYNPELAKPYDGAYYLDTNNPEFHYTYDQYLVDFLCGMITPELRGSYPPIEQKSTQYGQREFGYSATINIWEVIKRRDFNLLPRCEVNATLVDVQRLYNTRYYGNIRNSKYNRLLVTDPDNYKNMELVSGMNGFPYLTSNDNIETPYFLSPEFYNNIPQGEFEMLLVDTLKNNIFDRPRLLKWCEGYWELSYREKLYQGAVMLYIIGLSRKINVGM